MGCVVQSFTRLSRRALLTTDTELKLMAAAAMSGESSSAPVNLAQPLCVPRETPRQHLGVAGDTLRTQASLLLARIQRRRQGLGQGKIGAVTLRLQILLFPLPEETGLAGEPFFLPREQRGRGGAATEVAGRRVVPRLRGTARVQKAQPSNF